MTLTEPTKEQVEEITDEIFRMLEDDKKAKLPKPNPRMLMDLAVRRGWRFGAQAHKNKTYENGYSDGYDQGNIDGKQAQKEEDDAEIKQGKEASMRLKEMRKQEIPNSRLADKIRQAERKRITDEINKSPCTECHQSGCTDKRLDIVWLKKLLEGD